MKNLLANKIPVIAAPEIPWGGTGDTNLDKGVEAFLDMAGNVFLILTAVAAAVAIGMWIWAGIQFKMAKNPEESSAAVARIKRVIIGLVIVLSGTFVIGILMKVIPTFLK